MSRLPRRGYRHISVLVAAVVVGVLAALYAKLMGIAQAHYSKIFQEHSGFVSSLSPIFFLAAVAIVRKLAPEAKGSGIPQVLEAIAGSTDPAHSNARWRSPLISLRTAFFKILSSLIGVLGGASIGREGPTVQISVSVFAYFGRIVKKHVGELDFQSLLSAGAAAGIAAAFNTPLAGITFAIEEVAEGAFGAFRQTTMLSVIIAGITAQVFLGNYLYFGRPSVSPPDLSVIYQSVLIGLSGGILGGIFAKALAYPTLTRLPKHWIIRALVCGAVCSAIGYMSEGATAGSGYEVTELELGVSSANSAHLFFPVLKMITTIFSYLSGMAGGIFSPSLSIGAGIGMSLAKLFHFANFRTCALMGMVSFFSGVVQAPLTAVIIVMEMTDRHVLILPFMVSAFLGQAVGRYFMPVPLYRFLANKKQEG